MNSEMLKGNLSQKNEVLDQKHALYCGVMLVKEKLPWAGGCFAKLFVLGSVVAGPGPNGEAEVERCGRSRDGRERDEESPRTPTAEIALLSSLEDGMEAENISSNSTSQSEYSQLAIWGLAGLPWIILCPLRIMILVYIRIYQVAKTRTRTMSEKKRDVNTLVRMDGQG
ncbi:unnamed protein product [Pleuronectes platessa]|uniref:Uncharacterized protein n=1 Tax=Pleuronectes platessa TaxID=8262 RepID=A0A9N7USJ4_PLEPL|nr:unnamed protein product [Pleuronectes platessa]